MLAAVYLAGVTVYAAGFFRSPPFAKALCIMPAGGDSPLSEPSHEFVVHPQFCPPALEKE